MAETPESLSESDLPIAPVYDQLALDGFDAQERLGAPGKFPFTRGVYPSMYTGRPWTMRQYAGFGNARESNERYHQLVKAGTGGLRWPSTCPPRWAMTPTSRSPAARSARSGSRSTPSTTCGRCSTGLPLDKVSTSMTINAPASTLLLMYQLAAEQGASPASC